MNYLTHFYHNHRILKHPLTDSEYYWGTILPDLVRVYDRNCRFRLAFINELYGHEDRDTIWDGIRNHIQADKMFHQSSLFLRLQKRFFEYFHSHETSLTTRQQRITAHLGVEFLFDHHFHIHDPEMTMQFYATLNGAPLTGIVERIKPVLPETKGMIGHLERFLNMRYLTRYDDMDYLAEVMIYKMNRPGQKGVDELKNEIIRAFAAVETETGKSLDELDELLLTIQ